jgi:5-oxoprolinase (ATP-hydrolysing)
LAGNRKRRGAGKWRGGDGAIRRIRFLEPMTVSILSSRRAYAPFGMKGGAPGAKGRNWVERAHLPGETPVLVPMTGTDKCDVRAGDVFVVETPGGGGYGGAAELRKAAE